MKPLPLVLAASLAANAALVAVVLCAKPAFLGFDTRVPGASSASGAAGASGTVGGPGLYWASLEKDDLKALAQRLRAAEDKYGPINSSPKTPAK